MKRKIFSVALLSLLAAQNLNATCLGCNTWIIKGINVYFEDTHKGTCMNNAICNVLEFDVSNTIVIGTPIPSVDGSSVSGDFSLDASSDYLITLTTYDDGSEGTTRAITHYEQTVEDEVTTYNYY